jgi:hypothetical protein
MTSLYVTHSTQDVNFANFSTKRKRFFSSICIYTKPKFVEKIKDIAESRLATAITTVIICFHLDLPWSLTSFAPGQLARYAFPCASSDTCRNEFYRPLVHIFERLSRLDGLVIAGSHIPYDAPYNSGIPHSNAFEAAVIRECFGKDIHILAHGHLDGYVTAYGLLHSIFTAITVAEVNLTSMRLQDLSVHPQRACIIQSLPFLHATLHHPRIQNLTRLWLEIDLFNGDPQVASDLLVCALGNNPGLRELKLDLRPVSTSYPSFQKYRHLCHPLLKFLAEPSPMRLRWLWLTGLFADSTTTLDMVVRRHTDTLRMFRIEETYFDPPNRLRTFFQSVADSQLEYFALPAFKYHDSNELVHAYYTEELVEQEEDVDVDDSENGWVMFGFEIVDEHSACIFDETGPSGKKGDIKRAMGELIEQLDCGAIEDDEE